MNEYHIKLVIEPETYDYGENEIAYRVYIKKSSDKNSGQLISERTLPVLEKNQLLLDNFSLNIDNDDFEITLINFKKKAALVKKIIINGIQVSISKKKTISATYRDKFVHIVCCYF